MDQLQTFNNSVFGELPIIIVDKVEWFGATEAATALSFANPYDAIKNHVDNDDLAVHEVTDNLGRKQKKKFTTESGLYALIFGAARQGNNLEIKEKAKAYKRWVTNEVLPSIRKTGSYGVDLEGLSPLLQLMIQTEQRQKQLEATQQQQAEQIDTIKETFMQRDEDWRNKMNSLMKGAAFRMGGNYQELRRRSYDVLEERARCDLDKRLRNLVERLEAQGATKTQLKNTTRMTVIEADPKLKEIYTTIVKELSIGTMV